MQYYDTEKSQFQLKHKDLCSLEKVKNKGESSRNINVQVSRSPSPVKSSDFFPKMFFDSRKGTSILFLCSPAFKYVEKIMKNEFLKTPVLFTKPSKTFSEKLVDLRNKEKIGKSKGSIRKAVFSKGFIKSTEKNKLANQRIFQVIGNKRDFFLSSEKDSYDPYSSLYLSKRTISHDELSLYLEGKKIVLLPELLKTVTAPSYELPDFDGDWIVMGIVAYKSIPKYIQTEKKDMDIKSKYCVLTLTDLKWEISLFLFRGAFERYWKTQVGYVIAILNPGIMKPKKIDSGEFSLVLSYEYDSLLELGLSRDLGFCSALKRDGKQCTAWVDICHSEVCGFHVDQGMRKARNSRMEVAVGTKLCSPKKSKYMLTKVGYSNGPKSAEGLLSEHTGWVHDPWNGNIFIMPNTFSSYKQYALSAKKVEKIHKFQKNAHESNMTWRFLASEYIPKKSISDISKSNIEAMSSISVTPDENSTDNHTRPFSVQSIKRIGFDPYNHTSQISRQSSHSTSRSLSLNTHYSSDSELEII
ncbi:hypothetical protein PORY_000741 [Pneumocystis oryctolagi]|uniref:Uncharacterized protein n=1 Tax=Pneumocystis oryctolagi TaxID=42067 RepID=A0ACB7CE35_9ASCO|nr:hypothetical protein PORY_000741 [Pneumocystis oryctolagi]